MNTDKFKQVELARLILAVEKITNYGSVASLSEDIQALKEAMCAYREAHPDYWKDAAYQNLLASF